jgi:flagellar motor switch protein FliG
MFNRRVGVSGTRKAAILLISLGSDISAQILKKLPESMIQKVTYEIANIEHVTAEEREKIVDDFIDTVSANKYALEGGIDYAKELLQKAMGSQRAKEVMDILTQLRQSERPFSIARKADIRQLTNFLMNEHPQTIALIMCYMQPEKSAMVLSQLPDEVQTEVAERLGTISRISPQVIRKIEKILEEKFSGFVESETENIGGVKALVDILNSVDRSTGQNILNNLESTQPELAETVKASLFVFEDIINLDRASVQRALREISNDDLALALKGASEHVAEFIFSNMSQRASELIREDIQFMGPVRLSAVEEAQQKIVSVLRRLDETGEIIIVRGDQNAIIM